MNSPVTITATAIILPNAVATILSTDMNAAALGIVTLKIYHDIRLTTQDTLY